MLIRLMPEQIAANWEFLKNQIVDSGPQGWIGGEERYVNVLDALLVGELHCWVEADTDDKGFHIMAVAMTQFLFNTCADVKNLLIYSLVGVENIFDSKRWKRALLTLAQFARANDCQNIIAYSDNPRVIRMAEALKGNTSQRLLVFSLN